MPFICIQYASFPYKWALYEATGKSQAKILVKLSNKGSQYDWSRFSINLDNCQKPIPCVFELVVSHLECLPQGGLCDQ